MIDRFKLYLAGRHHHHTKGKRGNENPHRKSVHSTSGGYVPDFEKGVECTGENLVALVSLRTRKKGKTKILIENQLRAAAAAEPATTRNSSKFPAHGQVRAEQLAMNECNRCMKTTKRIG